MSAEPGQIESPATDGPGAIVTGADYRGLGLVRSLGRRGIPVWVLTHEGHLLAAFSRYASRVLPWHQESERARVAFLLDLAAKNGLQGWLLLPTDDDAVSLCGRHHDELSKVYRLTTPPEAQLRRIADKWHLRELAMEMGIDQPWSCLPQSREEVRSFNRAFPVILKPRSREISNRLTNAKAWRVDSLDELLGRYDEACTLLPPEMVMIQEIIPGSGEAQFSLAALCDEGRILASLTARRTRQFPMDFGRASTFVETIHAPELEKPSSRLLAAMKFTGMVEIEYKRDPRDGGLKLLDVNPRVWGWQNLCGPVGVDFPYLLWLLMQGRPVPATQARPGVKWTRLTTDLLVCAQEIASGRMSLGSYFGSLRGPRETAIFASDDPLPGLLEAPLIAFLFGKRILSWKKG